MDLLTVVALLIAVAILLSAWQRQRISDAVSYRKAVLYFLTAVIVDSVSIWPWFIVLARVAAAVLLAISFYLVCCAWGAPVKPPVEEQPTPKL